MTSLISFAFSVAMIPWRAFVLLKMWGWFIVPVWPNLAAPKWNLYGIGIIVGFLTHQADLTKKETTSLHWITMAIWSFVAPALSLLIAWLIKVICL